MLIGFHGFELLDFDGVLGLDVNFYICFCNMMEHVGAVENCILGV